MQAYAVYLRIFYSSKVAQQQKLKTEILANKKELLQTSAQDQFARWAKLRRSVDKGLADLEKLSEYLIASLARRITLLWADVRASSHHDVLPSVNHALSRPSERDAHAHPAPLPSSHHRLSPLKSED